LVCKEWAICARVGVTTAVLRWKCVSREKNYTKTIIYVQVFRLLEKLEKEM